jgi:exodeoxyribonuclease V alpha subunit
MHPDPANLLHARGRADGVDVVEGEIDGVRYRDPHSGFSVLRAKIEERDEMMVGELAGTVEKGAKFIARGKWVEDQKHGRQFKFETLELRAPTSEEQIIARLVTYPGVGERTAERIVEQFGERTWAVMDSSIDDLLHIPGIGKKAFAKIREHHHRQSGPVAQIKNRLIAVGAPPGLAKAIHEAFGDRGLGMLDNHPFKVAIYVERFGFKLAEKFARATGLDPENDDRVEAGVIQTMVHQRADGHCGMPPVELEHGAADLLGRVRGRVVDEAVERLVSRGALRYEAGLLLLSGTDKMEKRVASQIRALTRPVRAVWDSTSSFELSGAQHEVLAAVARSGVTVLTGGPGTGKSTAIAAVLEMAERARWEVTLCAPTGRAAKRLTEATGKPASTIHRLLRPLPSGGFHYDQSNPLPAGLVIVDEVSMLDLELADALFAALSIEHRILLVGDVDQLPSVGPGNVLSDVIDAAQAGINVSVVRLSEIFRQASGSSITSNAHRMLRGENIVSDSGRGKDGQFYILHTSSAEKVHSKIVHMAVARIPLAYSLDPVHQVQILCPTHHGPAGTDAFNSHLQLSHCGREAESFWAAGGRRFCEGDRVMQMRNDYERNVFNGDIGTVVALDESALTVDFDGAHKQFKRYDTRTLRLAYAMTIHKSQGGEFPAVIVPVLRENRMLDRNLLYTAITRAKTLCILVGHRDAIERAVQTVSTRRWTRLTHRLVSTT